MQSYKEIALSDVARDAVMQLQENIKTIASNNAGTSFPTENLYDGMLCYRTDEKKYYTYDEATKTWEYGLARALKYRGSVETYSDLPTDPEVGDMWNVKTADETQGIKAGDNVAWSGSEWDNMGGTVDLSGCAMRAELQQDIVDLQLVNDTKIFVTTRNRSMYVLNIDNVDNSKKAACDGNGNNISNTYAPKSSPTFTGVLTAETVTITDKLNIPGGRIWIE